jgi:hypothetical protein
MKLPRTGLLLGAFATLGACGLDFPRDIDGTLARVRATHVIRVGLIQGPAAEQDRPSISAFLARLRAATGAAPQVIRGSAEPLLAALEDDQLDLVIGEIAQDSPWMTEVTVVEPLAERTVGQRRLGLSPIARNGENAWVMLVEHETRELRAGQ